MKKYLTPKNILIAVIVLFALGALDTAFNGDKASNEAISATPKLVFSPTTQPTLTIILTPVEQLKQNITIALGTSNRNLPRPKDVYFDKDKYIIVEWAINDNLTEDLIVFGAKHDVEKILKAVKESNLDYVGVAALGTFIMQDAYGNQKEENVVAVQYLKSTIQKINFDNFLSGNSFLIADENFNNKIFR